MVSAVERPGSRVRHVNLGAAKLGDRGHVYEGGNARETCSEHGNGDVDFVLGRDHVWFGIEGVEQQHGALEHVHDARRHRGHGELFTAVLVAQMSKGTWRSQKPSSSSLLGSEPVISR